jgi:hypothetical protein
MTAQLCRMSKSAVWESSHSFEERENAFAPAQVISKLSGAPNSLPRPKEEENVMAWIGD